MILSLMVVVDFVQSLLIDVLQFYNHRPSSPFPPLPSTKAPPPPPPPPPPLSTSFSTSLYRRSTF